MKVKEQIIKSKKAVVIIPEIYGVNQYIKDWANYFNHQGYDAFCVDFSSCSCSYLYSQSQEAYHDFMIEIGFDQYKAIEIYIGELRQHYKKIILFGSSVGATIAWRLSDSPDCDGMIGYYGSRIRDYLEISPICPCLLLFPEQEKSFVVSSIIPCLEQKDQVEICVLPGKHGFADPYGRDFCEQSGKKALNRVGCFLRKIEQL